MLHLLNKNLNLQFFILILLIGWTGWIIFTRMTLMPTEGCMVLFQMVAKVWTWSHVVMRCIVLLLVVTMTLGVIHEFQRNHFHDNRTYMPGIFLLLMLNCGKFLYIFSPMLLTAFFIALIMMIYKPGESASKIKDRIFTIGLVIAIATMLDISAFGILLFLTMIIAINNVSPLKDNLILFFGLLCPYIYAFSIAFMTNALPTFLQSWHNLVLFVPVKQFTHMRLFDYIMLGYFVILTIYLMVRGKQFLDNKLIVIRQAFTNTHLLFIAMFLFLWLGNIVLPNALLYILLPTSIYLSVAVIPKRRRFIFDILFVAFCVLLWL
jgi:hypothetical protein